MTQQNSPDAPPPQPLDPWFLDLLACPCEQHHPVRLTEAQDALVCACGKYSFPVKDGIPILLVEEATILNPDARPEDVAPGRESTK